LLKEINAEAANTLEATIIAFLPIEGLAAAANC